MVIVLQIIIIFLLIYIIYFLLYSMMKGAPYAPLGNSRIKSMLELLKPEKGKYLADLGSGDGRIINYFSKVGVISHGYEINPVLFFLSVIKTRNTKGKIFLKNYWNVNLSKYNYITIYGVTYIMPELEKKLFRELKPGSKIVTNHFKFPNIRYDKKLNDVYLYIVK